MKRMATALAVLLVLASLAAAPGAAQRESYAGSHVSFETSSNAVTDYTVDGESMLSTVQVQSANDAEGSGIVEAGTSLSTVTSIEGAGLSVGAETETSAAIDVDGSASMDAHDNGNGVLVVRAGDESQYVQANLSEGAEASSTDDGRVEITTADGVEGSFIVVGDGEATVNDEGDVAATLGVDGELVFRAYPDEKTEDDDDQERLIADGQAAGEVHVMSDGDETVTDTVAYGSDSAVEAQQSAEGQVEVTVDRTAEEGKVVITSVSDSAMETASGVAVQVDGEAAAEASSYSELEGAIDSDQSKYLVQQSSAAEGSADVLVAVNHFSERTITMSEADDGNGATTADDGEADATSSPGQPGFGVGIAIVSLLVAAFLARRTE